MVSTSGLVAVLAVLGVALMLISSAANDDELRSGSYTSIAEAEEAVGFAIPHARETGAFTLKRVDVIGGTKKPGDINPELVLGEYGTTHTEWRIELRYQAEPDQRFIVVMFSPRTELPAVDSTPGAPEVHGRAVSLQDVGPPAPNSVQTVTARWSDKFGFMAFAALASPVLTNQGVKLEEFLTLARSVR